MLNGTGEVHAFEPNPNLMPFIRENNKTKSEPFVQLNEFALSDHKGTIAFYDTTVGQKSGFSTALLDVAKKNPVTYAEIHVPCMTLDEYIKDHKIPDIIKIDVEAYEFIVLTGASRLLEQESPTIVMEVWDAPHIIPYTEKALAILRNAGYKSYEILPDGDIQPKPWINKFIS